MLLDVCIYQPLHTNRMWHKVNFFYVEFNRFEFVFSSSRPVPLLRLKNPVCPNILPITGERIVRFIPFMRVLVRYEMQTALSRIWIRVTVFIFNDDNYSSMGSSERYKVTPSLALLPGLLWSRVVVLISPICRSNISVWKLLVLDSSTWYIVCANKLSNTNRYLKQYNCLNY